MLLWLMNLDFAGGDGGTAEVYESASPLNGVNRNDTPNTALAGTDLDYAPTVSDVNASNFGVRLQPISQNGKSGSDVANVDYIRLTIYYTESGGGTAVKDIIGGGFIPFAR